MRISVKFDHRLVGPSDLAQWEAEGLIRRQNGETFFVPHEERHGFPLPKELEGMPLMFFIQCKEKDRQVVCYAEGTRRRPYPRSIRSCADDSSASFLSYKQIMTVYLDEDVSDGDYIFIEWHMVSTIKLNGGPTIVYIPKQTIWEGLADEYMPSEDTEHNFSQAITAVRGRVACLESGGTFCKGPHYADLSGINGLSALIARNREAALREIAINEK